MKKFFNLLIYVIRWLYSYIRPKPTYYHRVKEYKFERNTRPIKLVVSLTSYPGRIKTVHYTIESILNQDLHPDIVCLWLAHSQFQNKEKDLPSNLLRLCDYGLSIEWCEDYRSYKKLVPSLRMYPNAIIVTADDDVYYPPNWLQALYVSYCDNPNAIHCHRAHKIKFNKIGFPEKYCQWGNDNVKGRQISKDLLFTGVGGVLYPPKSLFEDVCKSDMFMSIAKDADDIWFWAMAMLNNTDVCVISDNIINFDPVFNVEVQTLWNNNSGGNNDVVIKSIYNTYPQLLEIVIV